MGRQQRTHNELTARPAPPCNPMPNSLSRSRGQRHTPAPVSTKPRPWHDAMVKPATLHHRLPPPPREAAEATTARTSPRQPQRATSLRPAHVRGKTAQHPRQARGHTLSCAYARPFAEPALAILQTRGKHPPSLPRELRPRPDATGQRTTLHHRLLAPHPPTPSGRRRWWRRRQLYHHTLALAPEGTAPKARRR